MYSFRFSQRYVNDELSMSFENDASTTQKYNNNRFVTSLRHTDMLRKSCLCTEG